MTLIQRWFQARACAAPFAMCVLFFLHSPSSFAANGFPEYVTFPAQIVIDADQQLIKENLAEIEFESTRAGPPMVVQRGAHYVRWFKYQPAAGEPALGYGNGSEARIWKAMQAELSKSGWQVVFVDASQSPAVMRRNRDGKDSWLRVKMDAPQGQVNVEMIEAGSAANALVHAVPTATPEKFAEKDDIPYLSPHPGSTRKGAGRGDGPMDVSVAFASGNGSEPVLVGNGAVTRTYQGPGTLSALQFMRDHREALTRAGWKVLYPRDARGDGDNSFLIAHYTANGRDIWARLFYEFGANISYAVTDIGAEDWGARFDKDCRLPLYGVLFDFNKASLKTDSEPVLNKAAALLKSRPGFNVEVQGHTDNVGGDDYNLKLSDARAASVKQWLSQHGIEASRLASHGYGKAQPIADNNTDAGRARNRRVELVKTGCRK